MGRRARITAADKIERERRTAAIMQMRVEGHSLRAIGEAQRPPVSGVAVYKTIRKALDRMVDEATAQIRKIESVRLDEATAAIYPAVSAGDLVAIDRMLHIMRRRARLLGLDTPVRWAPGAGDEFIPSQVRIEIAGGPDPEHVRRLEERLEGRDLPRVTSLPSLN